ncbi:MAG: methyltransferase domain-containing protein [Patescibacteria group bacterium]
MEQKVGLPLTNEYAKRYYDTQVGPLESYTQDRWHSSPVRAFEYRQTKRALEEALGNRTYGRALEVGPGDGVWTELIKSKVTGPLYLVEQSQEMLKRAQARFTGMEGISFEHSDFQASNPPGENDLIAAIRCFEYFDDKPGALAKMRTLLAPGGRIIIITKNAKLITTASSQNQTLHSDQLTRSDMQSLARQAGLTIEHTYPAVLRWKAAFAPMRVLFDVAHRIAVWSHGALVVPFLTERATESYVYVMRA